jgi:RimK family alpha-L-glutamate ligase
MRLAIVAHATGETNLNLVSRRWGEVESLVLSPHEALARLEPGDAALGRLDVRPTLDGIEDGLWSLACLPANGVTLLNAPAALLAAHDKLVTARALRRAGLPHPATRPLRALQEYGELEFPLVVKPRFGSWGRHVVLCRSEAELAATVADIGGHPWFRSHGALVQELIPPLGHDLRLIVVAGAVVGAVKRVAPPGEWRTNVALGATRVSTSPPPIACTLAVAAAAAVGGDLVAVDLLPLGPGRYVVLEINGAAEFSVEYSLAGTDVFDAAIAALMRCVNRSEGSLPPPVAAAAV